MENSKAIGRKALKLIATIALLVCAGLSAILLLTGCDNIKQLLPSDDDSTIPNAPRGIYTVTFDANGGVLDDVYKLQTTPDGTLEEFPTAPTYEGKDFYCWTLRKDNLDTRLSLLYAYSSDATVYACWKDKSGSGGNGNGSSGDGSGVVGDGDETGDSDPLKGMQVLITFDANGGTVNEVPRVTRKTDENGMLEDIPVEPVLPGKIFNGWYLTVEANPGEKVLPGRTFVVDTTVYATWRDPIVYTVEFDANGGELAGPSFIKTDEYGCLLAGQPNPIRDGWAFKGWYTETEEPYGKRYFAYAGQVFKENLTLYAIWKQEVFLISFNANGGTLTDDEVIETGTDGRLPRVPSHPKSFDPKLTFDGWGSSSTSEHGMEDSWLAIHTFTRNTEFYAVWTELPPADAGDEEPEDITLYFFYNYDGVYDESAVDEYTFRKGQVLVRFPELTRDGYNHVGWMESPDDDRVVNIGLGGYKVIEAKQFFAKWLKVEQSGASSETASNVLSGYKLDGRVYGMPLDYISHREREISEFKEFMGLNVFAGSLEQIRRNNLVSASEWRVGEPLKDDSNEETIGCTKGPEDIKYGFLFDLPETRAAFNCGMSYADCEYRTQLATVWFTITPITAGISLDDYEFALETTLPDGLNSGVSMAYVIRQDGDGPSYVYGKLDITYEAMMNLSLAAFVKVTAKNPSSFNLHIDVDGCKSLSFSDTYICESFITYSDYEILYSYIFNAPYVTLDAYSDSRVYSFSNRGIALVIRKSLSASFDEDEDVTVVVILGVEDFADSFVPTEFKIRFVTSSGTPLPLVDEVLGYSSNSCQRVVLDYFYMFDFDFVLAIADDGLCIAWHCGGGMSLSKIILMTTDGPKVIDVSGKEHIEISNVRLDSPADSSAVTFVFA